MDLGCRAVLLWLESFSTLFVLPVLSAEAAVHLKTLTAEKLNFECKKSPNNVSWGAPVIVVAKGIVFNWKRTEVVIPE